MRSRSPNEFEADKTGKVKAGLSFVRNGEGGKEERRANARGKTFSFDSSSSSSISFTGSLILPTTFFLMTGAM